MKKVTIILLSILMFFSISFAKDKHSMDHSSHKGVMIHSSVVDNYQLAYHLIDMGEHAKQSQKPVTHHMMVYGQTPHGHPITDGKVGFLIIGPDGTRQQTMAMKMGEGYGSDVNLLKGKNTIKVKMISKEKTLKDTFDYINK